MSLSRTTPVAFHPHGLSDALDSSSVFEGAMASLQDIIPDPSTKDLWQCRPAAFALPNFASGGQGPFSPGFSPGFSGPPASGLGPFSTGFSSGFAHAPGGGLVGGPITALIIFGNIAYGMISGADGTDYPFGWNLLNNTPIAITNITAANRPVSPPAAGAWVPPSMALVGTNILVTHSGFTGAGGNFFGWIDITNPSAITWNAGNLTGLITFTTAPSAVQNFNGRAYWATNPPTGTPSLVFSDVLVPRNVTNANQALTFDDNVQLTALAGLPLFNQLGGIIQALIVFKGLQNIYQVTGDAALNNLAKNSLNIATGTLAPNTISSTPKGLAFVAPDGLRFIDFQARVTDPIGHDGSGKTIPFYNSVVPSRMCADANGTVIRISTQDGHLTGAPTVEYWFDMARQVWSGPHTFAANLIVTYQNTFIMAPHAVPGQLWQSDYQQTASSSFTENGVPMLFNWTTCMLPDTDQMSENAMIETTIHLAMAPSAAYSVAALNQNGGQILTASITSPVSSPTIWGQFTWGQALWGGSADFLFPRQVPWPVPLVFRRAAIQLTGISSAAVKIGTLHMRYEKLGYLQQSRAA